MITRRRGSWLPLLQVAGLQRLWEISKSENLKTFSFWVYPTVPFSTRHSSYSLSSLCPVRRLAQRPACSRLAEVYSEVESIVS
jgi:hypothetical protein